MIVRPSQDDIPNCEPWERQLVNHFKEVYAIMKQEDSFNVLQLNLDKLDYTFISNYATAYRELSKGPGINVPDRHKLIALLTCAFLDTSPFDCNKKRLIKLLKQGANIKRHFAYPNEILALDICKVILTEYGGYIRQNKSFRFHYPNNAYVNTSRKVKTSYEYELFLLYQHYLRRKEIGKAQFSIHQMAHFYFVLEISNDIARYGDTLKYYS